MLEIKMLIVESDPVQAKVFVQTANSLNGDYEFKTKVVGSLLEAQKIYRVFDALTIDLTLSDSNVSETIDWVLGLPRWIPCYVISDNDGNDFNLKDFCRLGYSRQQFMDKSTMTPAMLKMAFYWLAGAFERTREKRSLADSWRARKTRMAEA